MPDEMEIAQEMAEKFRESSLAKARQRSQDEDPLIIEGVRHCLDCENPIPQKRLKVYPKALRCVACETKKEKLYAKGRA